MKTRNLIFPKLVIILFCLFAFQKGYSQNSNLINVDQNLKILEIYDTNYSYVRPYIFKDYDNKDNIWIQNYYNNLIHLYRVNVDFDTLENNEVTIRHRDTMEQERVKIDDLLDFFKKNI